MPLPLLTNQQYANVEAHLKQQVEQLLTNDAARDRKELGLAIGNQRIMLTLRFTLETPEFQNQLKRCFELVHSRHDHRLHADDFDYAEEGRADLEYIIPGLPTIRLDSLSEEWDFVRSHPCPCGGGWEVGPIFSMEKHADDPWGRHTVFTLVCLVCEINISVTFRVDEISNKYHSELRNLS